MHPLQYAIEGLSEVPCKGVAEDVFETSVRCAAVGALSPAGGEAEPFPAGSLITGPLKSPLGIDEGLEPDERMTGDALPVAGYPSCRPSEEVRGQVRNRHPGQDKKSGVHGDLVEISSPFHPRCLSRAPI